MQHGHVTVTVTVTDQGKEGKHQAQDQCMVTKLHKNSKYHHKLHEYCNLMVH